MPEYYVVFLELLFIAGVPNGIMKMSYIGSDTILHMCKPTSEMGLALSIECCAATWTNTIHMCYEGRDSNETREIQAYRVTPTIGDD